MFKIVEEEESFQKIHKIRQYITTFSRNRTQQLKRKCIAVSRKSYDVDVTVIKLVCPVADSL